jgi:tetratricopeptide (TPR) repeat protein
MSDPAPTSKRLSAFEKMTTGEGGTKKGDALAWYGLAMEYRSLARNDEAVLAFTTLREREPTYVPAYYQAGAVLRELGRLEEARTWLTQGVAAARQKGDTHALSELEQALAAL